MNKIPVGKTIRSAYGFAFGELGTIIGLIWVPMVLIAVLSFLPYTGLMPQVVPGQNPAAAGITALLQVAISIATLLLYCSIYVAVTRQALGLRKGGATVHFAFGKAEMRMFGALLLLVVVAMLFVGIYFLGVFLIGLGAGATGSKPLAAALVGLSVLAGVAALVYWLTRFMFLIWPVTVAEEKISLERGWTLTQGNFWRIIGVMVATLLPVMLIFLGARFAVVGHDLMPLFAHGLQSLSPQTLFVQEDAVLRAHMPMMLGTSLILAPFMIGLSLGASAAAYRALTEAPSASTEGDGPLQPA